MGRYSKLSDGRYKITRSDGTTKIVTKNQLIKKLFKPIYGGANGPVRVVGTIGPTTKSAKADIAAVEERKVDLEDNSVEQYKRNVFANAYRHQPTVIVMGGGPGSGKSRAQRLVTDHIGIPYEQFAVLDPDHILETVFDNDGSRRPDANRINDKNTEHAINYHYDFIFDGSAKDFSWWGNTLIRDMLKSKGYKVIMCVSVIDVDTAVSRQRFRAEKQRKATGVGRDVPLDYSDMVYAALEDAIPLYAEFDMIDSIFIYDNTNNQPELIFYRENGTSNCLNPDKIRSRIPDVGHRLCGYEHRAPRKDARKEFTASRRADAIDVDYEATRDDIRNEAIANSKN